MLYHIHSAKTSYLELLILMVLPHTEEKRSNIQSMTPNCYQGGYAPTAIPLVFEHYGRWGDEAQQFLKTLSLMSYDEDGHQNASNFTTYWRQRLSVQLQQCNARVITRKTSHLLEHKRKVKRMDNTHNY